MIKKLKNYGLIRFMLETIIGLVMFFILFVIWIGNLPLYTNDSVTIIEKLYNFIGVCAMAYGMGSYTGKIVFKLRKLLDSKGFK